MLQRGDGPRFTLKPMFQIRIGGRKNLDRDEAAEAVIARLVDFAKAASAHHREDFVRPESRARLQDQASRIIRQRRFTRAPCTILLCMRLITGSHTVVAAVAAVAAIAAATLLSAQPASRVKAFTGARVV